MCHEIPDLDKINSEYKDKGAAVYGLYGDLGMGISDDRNGSYQRY